MAVLLGTSVNREWAIAPRGQHNRQSMNSTESVDRPHRVYPGGAMILHYKTADNVGPAPAGLVPVER